MTNPVTSARQGIDNIRRSLGRTEQTPLSLRPAIYPARQPEATDAERFLNEVRKLSGVAQKLAADSVPDALRALVAEQNVRKATVWNTPRPNQLQITNYLSIRGVELISPNASKHEMALCDLGITEADYILPETGTVVLRSSAEQPRAVSLLPRTHLTIVQPEMLCPDLHQVFAECQGEPTARPDYVVFITGPSRRYRINRHARRAWAKESVCMDTITRVTVPGPTNSGRAGVPAAGQWQAIPRQGSVPPRRQGSPGFSCHLP